MLVLSGAGDYRLKPRGAPVPGSGKPNGHAVRYNEGDKEAVWNPLAFKPPVYSAWADPR